MWAIEQTRKEKVNTVEINGVVGGRRLSEDEMVRRKERWERGVVGEGSEIGKREADGYGVEAERGNVEGKGMSHVEIEEHGIGWTEECEGLDVE